MYDGAEGDYGEPVGWSFGSQLSVKEKEHRYYNLLMMVP